MTDETLSLPIQPVPNLDRSSGLRAHLERLPAWRRLLRGITLHDVRKRRSKRRRHRAALKLLGQFPRHADAPMHGLPASLVVSLTSYPPRFPTLFLTIKSLLDQRVKPDRIVLWIAHEDARALPSEVTDLEGSIFTVRYCQDLRSFKKIVPSLSAYPGAFIVICDDDAYYPDTWLKGLVEAHDPTDPSVIYYRGHRQVRLPDGKLAPYHQWQFRVKDEASLLPCTSVMPTGIGGVLYPPGALPEQTSDISLFRLLSETCDDSWLYFMWRSAGWKAKRVPGKSPSLINWPGTQEESLWAFHLNGRKDEHLRALSVHFDLP